MYRIFAIIVSLCAALGVAAQHRAVAVEAALGPKGVSLLYDARLGEGSHWGYSVGLNFSNNAYVEYDVKESPRFYAVPLSMYYLTGKGNHHFEMCYGVTAGLETFTKDYHINYNSQSAYVRKDDQRFRYYGFFQTGYRLQFKKGLLLRTGLCVSQNDPQNNNAVLGVLGAYFTLGYTF